MLDYPKTAEYRDIKSAPVSEVKVHNIRAKNGREYRLITGTAGYEPAGSCARWTDEYHAVTFYLDNARHGSRWTTLEKARERFESLTQ